MKKALLPIILFCLATTNSFAQAPCSTTIASAIGTDNQEVCDNSSITDVSYSVTGTSATVIGLPNGVTGSFNSNMLTISGTAVDGDIYNSETSTYTYTVITSGGCLADSSTTGIIAVNSNKNYSNAFYTSPHCRYNGSNPIPLFTPGAPPPRTLPAALPMSSYFETTGSIIFADSTTGEIDMNSGPVGDFTIKHIVLAHASCPNDTISEEVYISDGVSAMFSYDNSVYCTSASLNPFPSHPIPVRAPSPEPGIFTELTGGIVFLDSLTGEIDLANCTAGSYTITNTVIERNGEGCLTDVFEFQLEISNNSGPNVTVNSVTICEGGTATVTANGADTYIWFGGGSQSGENLIVTPTASTSYTVTGTSNGCSSDAMATVTVNPLAVIRTGNYTICSGSSVTLEASGGGSYIWLGNDTAIVNPHTITPTASTTYTVLGSNANCGPAPDSTSGFGTWFSCYQAGCPNGAESNITVTALPIITVNSATICTGESVTLTAAGGTTYFWSSGEQSNSITVSPTSTTTYTVTDNTPGCSVKTTATVTVRPLKDPNKPGECGDVYTISGNVFQDNNSNCTMDTFDLKMDNIPLKLYNENNSIVGQTYTRSGAYTFSIWDTTGTYTVKVDSSRLYTSQCGSADTISVTLSSINPKATDVNFIRECASEIDYGIRSVFTRGRVFPGQTHTLNIYAGIINSIYNLDCPESNSGSLKITITGPVTFNSVVLGALIPSVQGNEFTYTIADWSTVDMYNDFKLYFDTDTTAQSTDNICVHVELSTTTNIEINTNNNTFDFCYRVRNSFDPNIKEVYPVDIEPGFEDWFNYTIHFQNTGNANAINIRLKDTLDANLNLETFEVLGYSHSSIITLYNNVLTVFYPDIELPDSTSNPEGSQGFVQYRIKPIANLPLGTKINNTASIYFDYNPPIVTNTTVNEYKTLETSITNNEGRNTFKIYPNPNSGVFTIQSEYSGTYTVVNELGKTVKEFTTASGENRTVDLGNLSNGVYFILGVNNGELTHQKVVILK